MALAWFVGTVYAVGWFGLVLLGLAMVLAILRSKFDFVQDAVCLFLLLCLPVYHSGRYLQRYGFAEDLLLWVPAGLGAIAGAILGLTVQNYSTTGSRGVAKR